MASHHVEVAPSRKFKLVAVCLAALLLTVAQQPAWLPAAATPNEAALSATADPELGGAPGFMPAPGFSVTSRKAYATAWGPIANGGLNCGGTTQSRVCLLELRLTRNSDWADYVARMEQEGVSALRVSIAESCPASAGSGYTTARVSLSSSAQTIRLGCDYGQYWSIPSLDIPLVWEYADSATGRWAPAHWPVRRKSQSCSHTLLAYPLSRELLARESLPHGGPTGTRGRTAADPKHGPAKRRSD